MSANLTSIIQTLTQTIGQQETSGGTAGVGLSLNNPGALEYANWESAYGATPSSGRFASFPSLAQGWAALSARLSQMVSQNNSINSLLNTYAPPSDGNSNNAQRAAQLAASTGLDPSQSIASQASTGFTPPALLGPAATATGALLQATGASSGTNPILSAAGSVTGALLGATGATSSTSGFTWGRVALFIVGILCIGAGFLMFKGPAVIAQPIAQASSGFTRIRRTLKRTATVGEDAVVAA